MIILTILTDNHLYIMIITMLFYIVLENKTSIR